MTQMTDQSNFVRFQDVEPQAHPTAYIDPTAVLIGDVTVQEGASVWPGTILRADEGRILVRRNAVILDMVFIEAPAGSNVEIGEAALISHRVVIHGAKVGDHALVGIGAILLDRSEIGERSLVSAGSMVPPRMVVPPRSRVRGMPAKITGQLSDRDLEKVMMLHRTAWEKAKVYGSMYGSAPIEEAVQEMTDLERVDIDREIFQSGPTKLQKKLSQQFRRISFDEV